MLGFSEKTKASKTLFAMNTLRQIGPFIVLIAILGCLSGRDAAAQTAGVVTLRFFRVNRGWS